MIRPRLEGAGLRTREPAEQVAGAHLAADGATPLGADRASLRQYLTILVRQMCKPTGPLSTVVVLVPSNEGQCAP